MTIKTKPGLSVAAVNEAVADLEELAGNDENVDHYLLTYGSSGLSISGGSDVTLDAYLKDGSKLSTDQVIEKWRHETQYYKDCSVSIKQGSTMSSGALSSGDEIEVDLQSTDYDALKAASDQLVEGLREREDVMQVHSSIENAAPVVKVEVDPVKAQAEGLTPASIGSVIYSSLSGVKASAIRVNGEDVDVKVEFAPDRYDSIDKLQGMMITTASGTTLPLEDLADIYYQDSPQQIERKDKQYQVAITMQPQAEYKKTAEKDVKTFVNEWKLPENVSPATNSMDEMMGEELGALGGALVTGVFLIFIVMGIQFESPKYSLMVMVTIPFSLIGSFGHQHGIHAGLPDAGGNRGQQRHSVCGYGKPDAGQCATYGGAGGSGSHPYEAHSHDNPDNGHFHDTQCPGLWKGRQDDAGSCSGKYRRPYGIHGPYPDSSAYLLQGGVPAGKKTDWGRGRAVL